MVRNNTEQPADPAGYGGCFGCMVPRDHETSPTTNCRYRRILYNADKLSGKEWGYHVVRNIRSGWLFEVATVAALAAWYHVTG